MNWPNPSQYQDTIQNPGFCFQDPELKAGTVALTPLGLPRVASGNFASVYEVHAGTNRWAVRCFLRQVSDQHRRYSLLSQYLGGMSLQSLVGFEYLAQGIRVEGQWYPIVKMEWVEGEPLHIAVERELGNAKALYGLAKKWRGLVSTLRGSHLAHGDLQHGNVLVTPHGPIQLVDYDAMFLPSLRGDQSPELGHVNFQHPGRGAHDYDEWLDNFAALVIYLNLRALVTEPNLWGQYHTGENLFLSASDYKEPAKSAALRQLKCSADKGVAVLAAELEHCLSRPVSQVPDLEYLATALPPPPQPVRFSPAAASKCSMVLPLVSGPSSVRRTPTPLTSVAQHTRPLVVAAPPHVAGRSAVPALASPTTGRSSRADPKVIVVWMIIGAWVLGAMFAVAIFLSGHVTTSGQRVASSAPSPAPSVAIVPTPPAIPTPSPVSQQASSPKSPNNEARPAFAKASAPTPPARVSLEAKIQNPALRDGSSVEIFVDGARADASRASTENSALFAIANVLVGSRTVEIKHPDYETWRSSVALSEANARPLEVQLVPKPATFTVEVTPRVNYTLNVDGARTAGVGGQFRLPAERDLALEVRAKGYEVASCAVRFAPNGRDVWQVALTPVRLSLEGRIQNAALKNASLVRFIVDGAKADAILSSSEGSALFAITNAPAGKRMLEVAHPDYEPWKNFVTVSDGNARPLEVQLVPKPGTLVVEVSPWMDYALYSGGRPVPGKDKEFTLPAERDLTLQVRAKDHETVERKLQLPANGREVWRVTLSPGPRMILDAAAKEIKPSSYVSFNGRNCLSFGFLGLGKKVCEGEAITIQFQGNPYDIEVASIQYGRSYQLRYKGQSHTVPMRMEADPPATSRQKNVKTYKWEKTIKK